jgi:hypothetical protein
MPKAWNLQAIILATGIFMAVQAQFLSKIK